MELPPLRDVIARHGLAARKSLGQHFLFDLNITARIAQAAGDLSNGTVFEVGPGPGGLTRSLLACGAVRVIAVERDARCIAALGEVAAAYPGCLEVPRLEVIEGDALDVNLAAMGQPPRRIVANLPYNISTALLIKWLRDASAFTQMTLMFQKEVAERLTAAPRTKSYGRLSILTQWLCSVEILFDLNPRAFVPPPGVVSSVVQLTPRPVPLAPADFAVLERVTAAAFGQRRKMLRASLKPLGDAQALCEAAGVTPTARGEEVDVVGFCALARAVAAAVPLASDRNSGDWP
ncbi:MAG: 16S rRNA (adenine(1518)-N(6)/adenine(1519)-N(6))-dimethyltransferase RsmA [Alphaproteobacteria bacterium]|nr:16S rRNA (adenine(1518)-N(6)/adenine(1519)-N(6))-dimethyltransferase RsmA [Alphaproteobacteria bacterium]